MSQILPFQDWTKDECEFLLSILGNSIVINARLARLLSPTEFVLIAAEPENTRQYYFSEAKACCQRQFNFILDEGARRLTKMTVKQRARAVLIYKLRFESFLMEIVHYLEIYVGEEEQECKLELRLTMQPEDEKGLWGVFSRTVCVIIRGLFFSTKSRASNMAREGQSKVVFDQYLHEELDILYGLCEEDLVRNGIVSKTRRVKKAIKYMAGIR